MKKFIYGVGVIAITFMLIAIFNGCQKDGDLTGNNAPGAFKETTDITMPGIDAIQSPIMVDGTLNLPISISSDGLILPEISVTLDPMTGNFVNAAPADAELMRFLNSLRLTMDQKAQLEKAFRELNNCRKEFYVQVRNINQEILRKANREREELIRKFKNNLMTERQFKAALEDLNKRTRAAIESNSSRQAIIAGLTKCFDNYTATVKLILTPDQWSKFLAWYKAHR